ncbi:MAG: GHKL domain-containing protein, partial [Acidisphaera sp.]|nr:GHKL domain-containing protein [Acidisphaera sp.]
MRAYARAERLDAGPVDRLTAAVAQQEELTERFKSDNSLLQNSLSYVSELGSEPALGGPDAELAPVTGALITAILRLTLDTSPPTGTALEQAIDRFATRAPTEGPDVEAARALLAHARLLRDILPELDRTLSALVAVPTRQPFEETRALFASAQAAIENTAQRFRLLLYLVSLLLLVTVVRLGLWLRTRTLRAQRAEASVQTVQAELARVGRITTLGQFTASIAHEIAQPIGSARNNARAALNFLDRKPPELGDVREALDCIVDDADRARDIIDRIRDHIKKAPPRKHRFDLNDAITEVIALARSAIAGNRISVQTRLSERLFPVEGDRVQLQQVVLNLILNAVEAMGSVETGARELLISTGQAQGNGVLVTVRDSGPGIDPEDVEHVFEAFYTTKSSGVGMGLSICRSIINAHGGRLWVEANQPRGAVFQFTLPGSES